MKLFLTRKEAKTEDVKIPVELSNLKWSDRAASGHAASLSCGVCGESLGLRPFAMAYARIGEAKKANLVRLCEECGKKAEAP